MKATELNPQTIKNSQRTVASINEAPVPGTQFVTLDHNQLEEALAVLDDTAEQINDQSMAFEDHPVIEKQLEKDYRAIVAVQNVMKNNLRAIKNPHLMANSIFLYDIDDEDVSLIDFVGAIHVVMHDHVAEVKWIGSYGAHGGALLRAAMKIAKQRGATSMKLDAKWESEGFYHKMGFEQTGATVDQPLSGSQLTPFSKRLEEARFQEIVHKNPSIATLKALARNNKYHSARFVIYKDGSVVAGDSEHFTHQDIAPAMGAWEVRGYVQYMGDNDYAYRSMEVYSPQNKDHPMFRIWERSGIVNGNPEVVEETQRKSKDPILQLINSAVTHFGRRKLYGGNCGMFALALAKHLAKNGTHMNIAVICQDVWGDEDVLPIDIISADVPVYHVALVNAPKFYDADGLVTGYTIQKWIHQQYGDSSPALFVYDVTTPGLESLIRTDTAWSIPSHVFEEFFNNSLQEDLYRSMEVYSPQNKDHPMFRIWERSGIVNGNPEVVEESQNVPVLYHGTTVDNLPSIKSHGVTPRVGSFTQGIYGAKAKPFVFAANESQARAVYCSLASNIFKKIGHMPDIQEFLKYAAVLVIEKDRNKFRRYEGKIRRGSLEPGDYYSDQVIVPDKVLQGQDLMKWLQKTGADWGEICPMESQGIQEKWSAKYKRSIDCHHPRGFSQRAHCAARRKRQAGGKTASKSVNENNLDQLVHNILENLITQGLTETQAVEHVDQQLTEDLRKWFRQKWVRFGPDGKIRGACARGKEGEGKPKCLPQKKAWALGKKQRATAARRKRREDPNPEREGKARNVATRESIAEVTKVRISLDPNDLGAYVYDEDPPEPTTMIPLGEITNVLEPDQLHDTKPGAKARIARMVKALEKGKQLPPVLVRKYQGGYQILDGHHRFKAYRMVNAKEIPARIVAPENITGDITEQSQATCPHCGGPVYDRVLAEKHDACYYKVKSRYKVWPSAYASGALVQCRKRGAKNWGKDS